MQIFITYDLTSHHWLLSLQQQQVTQGPSCLSTTRCPCRKPLYPESNSCRSPTLKHYDNWQNGTGNKCSQHITQNNLSFLSLLFPKDVRKSLNIFFTLTACDSNTSHFKSNNLVRNALKPWQLKLQKNEHKTVCNSNCRGFACAGKDKSPHGQIWNLPANHRKQVIQDSSLWNHF